MTFINKNALSYRRLSVGAIRCCISVVLSFFFLLNGIGSFAQQIVEELGVRHGLSNNFVVSAVQDKFGYLWFATEEGLNRFDGNSFKAFYKDDASSDLNITANELNTLLDDPSDSILWIGTQRVGLNAYNYSDNTINYYLHNPDDSTSIATDDVTKVVAAADGNLWVCSYWQGVDYFDKKYNSFSHYNVDNTPGLGSNNVWTAADDGNGHLYVGHVRHGLSVIDLTLHTAVNYRQGATASSLPDNEVTALFVDSHGRIWVGTGKGLCRFDPATSSFCRFDDDNETLSHRVFDIRELSDGRLCMALELGGVVFFDGERFEQVMSDVSTRCLHQDAYANLWVGSWGNGVAFIPSEPPLFDDCGIASLFAAEHSSALGRGKIIVSLCVDDDGNMWIGTDRDGLRQIVEEANGTRRMVNVGGCILGGKSVHSSCRASDGSLWFGVFDGGLFRVDRHSDVIVPLFPSEYANTDVRSFYEDKQHRMWVCTSRGLFVFDVATQKMISHYELENNLVRSVCMDIGKRLWIGFFGEGLLLCDANMNPIRRYNVANGFPSNTINDIVADNMGYVYAGTAEALVKLSYEGSFEIFDCSSGMQNACVQSIVVDTNQNVWFSTNKGVGCLPFGSHSFLNYDYRDTRLSGSFSRCCKMVDSKGDIYFGSVNGLCHFSPQRVLRQRSLPAPRFTNLIVYEAMAAGGRSPVVIPVSQSTPVHLSYDQNNVSFEFNVSDYALNDRTDFVYKMENLDDVWYSPVSANSVTFRGLNPGSYTLKVKARLRNQLWDENTGAAEMKIVVHPPFYLSLPAKLFYALLIIALVVVFLYIYQKRMRAEMRYSLEKQHRFKQQRLNNERMRFFTQITHELRTPLTLIMGPLDDVRKSADLPESQREKLNLIHQSANRLLSLINRILEFRKTTTNSRQLTVAKTDLCRFVSLVTHQYKMLNTNAAVTIETSLPDDGLTLFFDQDAVRMMLDNLISNALKYTAVGSVTVSVRNVDDQWVEMSVADTGYGISDSALPHIFENYYQEGGEHQASGTGIGLTIVRNLVLLHQGQISVESEVGRGTTFHIRFSMDNEYPNARHSDAADVFPIDAPDSASDDVPMQDEDDTSVVGAKTQKPLVLVVEDNDDIAHYVAGGLSQQFEVHTASNGQEGLDTAINITPDIIISDVMMPVMDGIAMCHALKNDVRTSHIPVVMLTAKDTMGDKEEGYSAGADSYIVKPFSMTLLRTRINNLFASRRLLETYYVGSSIMALKKDKATAYAGAVSTIDTEFVNRVRELVLSNLSSERLDAEFISSQLCMSQSTLYRKMKALTGLSTVEFVRKVKVSESERLLIEGRKNMSEIAFAVGFGNQVYFRQCFKDEYGCTPSEYIRRLKEQQ